MIVHRRNLGIDLRPVLMTDRHDAGPMIEGHRAMMTADARYRDRMTNNDSARRLLSNQTIRTSDVCRQPCRLR